MKITPVAAPTQNQSTPNNAAQDARTRAIAKLTQSPVQDQNNIAVEELGAIMPKSQQQHTNEETVEATQDTESTTEVQDSSQESKVDKVAEKIKEESSYSSQLALLARKERALRAKAQQDQQSLKSREDALTAREAALNAKDQEYSSGYISKQRLKEQTLEALAEADVSYDAITQQLISNQTPQDPRLTAHIAKLEARLAKAEAAVEEGQKSKSAEQAESYKAALNQIETDVRSLVKADPEFETIKATNSVKDVVELIEATYKEEGRIMTIEEAAAEVEAHLVGEIEKLMKIEKIKKRQTPVPAVQKTSDVKPPQSPKQPQPMKTLTNATSSSRTLSAKERAILAFKGELKS